MKKKVLFMIPNLGGGGAEKVLVNLVNQIDKTRFDVTILTLFDEGVNRQFLCKDVKYRYVFKRRVKAFKHIIKVFSPSLLYKSFVKGEYDTVISYLEGETTRIISGCNRDLNKIAWVHIDRTEDYSAAFRSKREMMQCYKKMNRIIFVSEDVEKAFNSYTRNSFIDKGMIIKNVNNYEEIIKRSKEAADINSEEINLVSVGRLTKVKDFARMINIIKRINNEIEGIKYRILGVGKEEANIRAEIKRQGVKNIELLGYQTNPYKYVGKSDIFICCSHKEGYNTAANESVILNTPVLTTRCAGMREMLGDNKYGLVVDDNDEALYRGLLLMIKNKEFLKRIVTNQKGRLNEALKENIENIKKVEEII